MQTLTPTTGSSTNDYTVPAGHYWDLRFARLSLTTSATVATRNVDFRLLDATGTVVGRINFGTQTASSTVVYYVDGQGGDTSIAADVHFAFLAPKLTLQPGWKLRWVVGSVQSGDSYATVQAVVCDGTSASAPEVGVSNFPTAITVSNPQTAVTVSNFPSTSLPLPVSISGSIAATVSGADPSRCAGVTTTTDADYGQTACVQPVELASGADGNLPLWLTLGLIAVVGGFVFGLKLVRAR